MRERLSSLATITFSGTESEGLPQGNYRLCLSFSLTTEFSYHPPDHNGEFRSPARLEQDSPERNGHGSRSGSSTSHIASCNVPCHLGNHGIRYCQLCKRCRSFWAFHGLCRLRPSKTPRASGYSKRTDLVIQFTLVVNACCYGGAVAAISVEYPKVRSKLEAGAVPLLYSVFVLWMYRSLEDKGIFLALCFCGVPVSLVFSTVLSLLMSQVCHFSHRPYLELRLPSYAEELSEGALEISVWQRPVQPAIRAPARVAEEIAGSRAGWCRHAEGSAQAA